MDFLGIGILELMVILVVALVVLGPAKSISMAREAGRMLGQVKRAMGDLSKSVEEEEKELGRRATLGEKSDGDGSTPPEERS